MIHPNTCLLLKQFQTVPLRHHACSNLTISLHRISPHLSHLVGVSMNQYYQQVQSLTVTLAPTARGNCWYLARQPANRADKQRPHTLTPSLATAGRDPQKAPPRAPHPPKVGHSGARVAPPWHLGSASCWTLIFFLQVRLLSSVLVPLFGLPSLAPSAVCLLRQTQAGGRGN